MARVVIQVRTATAQCDALLKQVLVDVNDPTTREDTIKLITLQLVIAGATTHHDRLDVKIVQRVSNAMEQHAVVGDDLFCLVELAAASLRIATAKITGGQYGLHAGVPKHRLSRQALLAEKALRATPREVKHRFGFAGRGLWVADDGNVIGILNVQQRSRGSLWQPTGQLLIDEVNHLLFDGCGPDRRGWRRRLFTRHELQHVVSPTLRTHSHRYHECPRHFDGLRIGGIEHEHGRCITGAEALFTHWTIA